MADGGRGAAAACKPWVGAGTRRLARESLEAAGVPPGRAAAACESALYATATQDAVGAVLDDPLLAPVSAAQLAAAAAGEYGSRLLALVDALQVAGVAKIGAAAELQLAGEGCGVEEVEKRRWWRVGSWREEGLMDAGELRGLGWMAAAAARAAAAHDALETAKRLNVGPAESLHACPACGLHDAEEVRQQVRSLDEGDTVFLQCRNPRCRARSQIRG